MSLESALRSSAMVYGHIQLFRDASGWTVSVQHYGPAEMVSKPARQVEMGPTADPVEGLTHVLAEDARRTKDLERKYRAADKLSAPVQIDIEEAIAATRVDPFEEMFG